jgi:hypothetical protein
MIGMVHFLLSVRRMRGMKKLFQLNTNERMACVARAGFMIGKMITPGGDRKQSE